jgi:ClpX C4-type zinc finger
MSEIPPADILRHLESMQSSATQPKHHHDAILAAAFAYLLFRENGNEAFEKAALIYMQAAINSLLKDAFDQQVQSDGSRYACSFCCRSEPEVRLAAGPEVFICDSCVATLTEVFAQAR